MDYFCTVAPIGIATFIAFIAGVTALWEIKKVLERIADHLEPPARPDTPEGG